MQVSERVEGHYEIQDEQFGKAYAWRPGHLVIECYCGQVLTITDSASICGCGADHESTFREELCAGRLGDETLHPWRCTRNVEDAGMPC